MGFIGAYWRGEKPLWKSFFLTLLYGILALVIPGLLYINFGEKSGDDAFVVWMVYAVFIFIGTLIWWAVAVWRSSRISTKFWRILARTFVIVLIVQQIVSTDETLSKFGTECLTDAECLKKIKEENGN